MTKRGAEAEVAERLLAARARALGEPPPSPGEETAPVVAFDVGPERYGVTMDAVLRVERVGEVARVPGARPEFLGVVTIDGRPCPLVDVPALLRAGAPGAPRRWAIVLGRRAPELALAADTVDLREVPRALLSGAGPRLGSTAEARQLLASPALLPGSHAGGEGA